MLITVSSRTFKDKLPPTSEGIEWGRSARADDSRSNIRAATSQKGGNGADTKRVGSPPERPSAEGTRADAADQMRISGSYHHSQHVVWLTIAQAAARASVSTRTVKRWITSGLLPAVRLPSPKGKGHLRVRLNDLEALLARGTLR